MAHHRRLTQADAISLGLNTFIKHIRFEIGIIIICWLGMVSGVWGQEGKATLSLQEALEKGLGQQPGLKSAEAEYLAMGDEVEMAQTAFYPRLSANTFWTGGDMPMIFGSLPSSLPAYQGMVPGENNWIQDFTLMIPLYTGGKNLAQLKKARFEKETASHQYQGSRLELAKEIQIAWWKAQYFRELQQAYGEIVKESREQVKNQETAYQAGKSAYVSLLRNRTQLAQSLQMEADARKEYRSLVARLNELAGEDPAYPLEPAQSPLEPVIFTYDKASALEKVMETHPGLKALQSREKSAVQSVAVARGDYFPQVALMGMQDFFKEDNGGDDSGHAYGLVVSFPFFGSGESYYKKKQQERYKQKARYDLEAGKLKARSDFESAWAGLDSAQVKIEEAQSSLQQAEEEYRIMKLAYEAGKKTTLEYLDALVLTAKSRADWAGALAEYNIQVAELKTMMGIEPLSQP
jgi:outer membrane protein TolC